MPATSPGPFGIWIDRPVHAAIMRHVEHLLESNQSPDDKRVLSHLLHRLADQRPVSSEPRAWSVQGISEEAFRRLGQIGPAVMDTYGLSCNSLDGHHVKFEVEEKLTTDRRDWKKQSRDRTRAFHLRQSRTLSPVSASALPNPRGGPPGTVPGTAELIASVETAAERCRGQGFGLTAPQRHAVELHAMNVAARWCASHFAHYRDVSSNSSFDILACDDDQAEWHIEVKGTTGTGASVIVTRNEVTAARHFPRTVLVVVSGITLRPGNSDTWVAQGGTMRVIEP